MSGIIKPIKKSEVKEFIAKISENKLKKLGIDVVGD